MCGVLCGRGFSAPLGECSLTPSSGAWQVHAEKTSVSRESPLLHHTLASADSFQLPSVTPSPGCTSASPELLRAILPKCRLDLVTHTLWGIKPFI